MRKTVNTPIGDLVLVANINTSDAAAKLGREFDWLENPLSVLSMAVENPRQLIKLLPTLCVDPPKTLVEWWNELEDPEIRVQIQEAVSDVILGFFPAALQSYVREMITAAKADIERIRQKELAGIKDSLAGGTGSKSPVESSDSPTPDRSISDSSTSAATDANDTTGDSPAISPPGSATEFPSTNDPSTPSTPIPP